MLRRTAVWSSGIGLMITLPVPALIRSGNIVTKILHPIAVEDGEGIYAVDTRSMANNYLTRLKEMLRANASVRSMVLSMQTSYGYDFQILLANTKNGTVEYTWDSLRDRQGHSPVNISYTDAQMYLLSKHLDRLEAVRGRAAAKDIYFCSTEHSFSLSYGATKGERELLKSIGVAGLIDVFERVL